MSAFKIFAGIGLLEKMQEFGGTKTLYCKWVLRSERDGIIGPINSSDKGLNLYGC